MYIGMAIKVMKIKWFHKYELKNINKWNKNIENLQGYEKH